MVGRDGVLDLSDTLFVDLFRTELGGTYIHTHIFESIDVYKVILI